MLKIKKSLQQSQDVSNLKVFFPPWMHAERGGERLKEKRERGSGTFSVSKYLIRFKF